MKYLLTAITLLITNLLFAQAQELVVKVQTQTLSINLNDDNTSKTIVLNTHHKTAATEKLVIYNNAKEEGWKRSFIIYNSNDAEMLKLTTSKKEGFYEVPVKMILSKLKKDNDYFLYTMAVPTDPKRAATVRVRRVLVCKILLK